MFEIILSEFFKPVNQPIKSYLPEFKLSPETSLKINRLSLDFATNVYFTAAKQKPTLHYKNQMFSLLIDIASQQHQAYPDKTKEEYIADLVEVITKFEEIRKNYPQ